MPEHRYQQYCGLARALDVIGDRWTLLIVRELILGPRRFTDLMDGLPGISRNLLTERLRSLEADGVIARRDLPPPAARQVYELSAEGHDLARAFAPLIAWGGRRLGKRTPAESFNPRWAAVAMAGLGDREAAKGITATYQYVVGETAFHLAVDDGKIEAHDGWVEKPTVVLTTDEETWSDIVSGKTTASSAASAGALSVEGDRRASKRLGKILSRDRLISH